MNDDSIIDYVETKFEREGRPGLNGIIRKPVNMFTRTEGKNREIKYPTA